MSDDGGGDTIVAIVSTTIGSTNITGTDEYILGDVQSVAGDNAAGHVYGPEGDFIAGDGSEYRLREYDQEGRIMRTLDGPVLLRRSAEGRNGSTPLRRWKHGSIPCQCL